MAEVEFLVCSQMGFKELIGVKRESDTCFWVYSRIKEDRIFIAMINSTDSHNMDIFFWQELEEDAMVLVAAMESGDQWMWFNKEISPHENWAFMQKCMMWAIRKMRKEPAMEMTFRVENGKVTNSYIEELEV